MAKRNYDEEFKRDAVELLLSGAKGLKPLARDLGVCPATLWRWTRGTRGRGWTLTGHRQSQGARSWTAWTGRTVTRQHQLRRVWYLHRPERD